MLSQKQLTNIQTIRSRIAKEHQRPAGYRPNITCIARAEKVIATIVANEPDREALDMSVEIHELLNDVLGLTQSIWTAKKLLFTFKVHSMHHSQMVIVHHLVINRDRLFRIGNNGSLSSLEQACLPETIAMLRLIE